MMGETHTKDRSNHNSLRIAYLNVRGLSEAKFRTAERWMRQNKYDILFLSETWFSQERIYTASTYFITSSSRPPKNPNAVRPTCGILALCQPELQPRICLSTTQFSVTLRIGDRTISGVYLPPSLAPEVFKQTLENIPTSTVLVGDFNCLVSSSDIKTTKLKSYCSSNNLYHASHLDARLDHVWVRNDCHAHSNIYIPKQQLNISDHGLIGITIPIHQLNSINEAPPTRRYFLKHLRDDNYCERLRRHYEHFAPLINDVITQAYDATKGKTFPEIAKWVNTLDEVWNFAIHEACTDVLGTYLVDAAKQWPDRTLEQLAKANSMTSSTRLWKRSQRGRQARLISNLDHNSPLEEGIALFKSVYDDDFADPETTLHAATSTQDLEIDAGLMSEITSQSVKKVIRQYPKHKSCGPDGLHARIYAEMSESDIFIDHFTKLCLFYASVSCTPASWNISNTPLLPKQNGDTCPVTETRPVSLTNMARRYFETLLLRHLTKQPGFRLHANQAGFRRGFSTISHVLIAHESCRLPRTRRHTTSIYLDLTKAFDRVRHAPLLSALRSRGISESIVALLYHLMMHDCKSHIIVNGARSEAIERTRGVFQGSIIAPLLFNIAMDALAIDLDQIETTDPYPFFLLFADDIRFSVHYSNIDILQEALKCCEVWAAKFGLDFGIKKCGVVGGDSNVFTINNTTLPHVSQYKYLGIEFNADGIAWSKFHSRVLTKAESTLGMLFKCATSEWGHATRLALVKTFVLSRLQYGLGLLAHQIGLAKRTDAEYHFDFTKPHSLHINCLDFIFAFKTPAPLLESMANLHTPEEALTLAKATTTRHLNNLAENNPLRTIQQLIRSTPEYFLTYTNRSLLLASCSDTNFEKWRREYDALRTADPTMEPISLKRMILNGFHQRRLSCSILTTYISPDSRTSHGRIDMTLFIKDPDTRQRAIHWRSNRLLLRRFCEMCCKNMARTHVNDCPSIHENTLLDNTLLNHFETDKNKRRRKFGIHDNYTILDFLLNKQDWEKFDLLSQHLLDNSSR